MRTTLSNPLPPAIRTPDKGAESAEAASALHGLCKLLCVSPPTFPASLKYSTRRAESLRVNDYLGYPGGLRRTHAYSNDFRELSLKPLHKYPAFLREGGVHPAHAMQMAGISEPPPACLPYHEGAFGPSQSYDFWGGPFDPVSKHPNPLNDHLIRVFEWDPFLRTAYSMAEVLWRWPALIRPRRNPTTQRMTVAKLSELAVRTGFSMALFVRWANQNGYHPFKATPSSHPLMQALFSAYGGLQEEWELYVATAVPDQTSSVPSSPDEEDEITRMLEDLEDDD